MSSVHNQHVSPDRMWTMTPRALYVHIPFCASRCFYCDFTTYVAPKGAIDVYLNALETEMSLYAPLATESLTSVFFGGGTPTLLSTDQLQRLLQMVNRHFCIDPECEITMEANPGTVDLDKLRVLHTGGVNRLSFGAQTFNERLLMAIGRLHSVDEVFDGVRLAKEVGFSRINVDLMFGLPDQTIADVQSTLDTLIGMNIGHVSAYWLKVEPGTPFYQWRKEGMLPLPDEDAEGDMYDLIRQRLRDAGYEHYEVSNFALPDDEARHNLVYWRNEPYFAVGVGAHGLIAGERYENVKSLTDYANALAKKEFPRANAFRVEAPEAAEDTMMLGLRLASGVDDQRFFDRHGVHMTDRFGGQIDKLVRQGLLVWRDGTLCITERAWPVANLVFEQFVNV